MNNLTTFTVSGIDHFQTGDSLILSNPSKQSGTKDNPTSQVELQHVDNPCTRDSNLSKQFGYWTIRQVR